MARDKRKQARLDANLFVEFHSASSGENLGRGVVVDVSLSGLATETEVDLDLENEIDCHIEVPLKLRAKVVRAIREGQVGRYGLHFVGQTIVDKFLLKKILKGHRQTRKISL